MRNPKREGGKRRHLPLHISEFSNTTRIEAFSDGVIAIIVTIMVLELKVPELSEKFTHEEFMVAARHLAPKMIAYAMSFIIVCIFWVNHHTFFHSLVKSDAKFVWYNNILLFSLSLVPFGTAFLGEHPMQQEAIIAFGAILLMACLAFSWMMHYALFKGQLVDEDVSTAERWYSFRRNIPGVVLYILSIVLAPWSVWISWTAFFIVPLYYFMPVQFDRAALKELMGEE